ncbi:TPA: type II toxin-antitoxin system YafO family toxin [Klebsiella pneumoniae]|nr:type II toxin-antitoxin system YafO family toxin [Klebsiella pneumoniae]HBS0570352.1 type II toxin-antitoxin system YafO family toxin [Klebsiella pneumoniae]HBS0582154.1 type II toxin-antitoxin system YafO family toxin [Klebsiella pneumoniae]HBS0744821.1 type II toxin-antitoxin system YafO family toxin [Klebsiella pneumoniae]HBS0754946.1 type II toxin-antitoxin system YafO family toxin [Klebsiella pneumoniae]
MKVTWNSHSYARFLEPVFRVMPDLKTRLLTDFVSYKNGFYPDSFGKDGPYTAPGSVVSSRVYHVHLLFTKEEKKKPPIQVQLYKRSRPRLHPARKISGRI